MARARCVAAVAAVLLVVGALGGFGAERAQAQGLPAPPHTFFGMGATLDGVAVPDGAIVTTTNEAGAVVGSAAIEGGGWSIGVDAADAARVTFRIDGSDPSGAYDVISGAVTEVRLSLSSAVVSPPEKGSVDPPVTAPAPTRDDDPPAGDQPADCAFVDGVERVTAATAQVVMRNSAGTAFYIGNDEWVTAAHVVEAGGPIRLRTETFDREAQLVGWDVAADLALLRASGAGLAALTFGDHAALRLGETLGVAGYPMTVSGSPSVASGLLSKFMGVDGIAYIQTSAEVSPGNSGGALFTDCGLVVGVVVAKAVHEQIEGIAWAVALPTINDRLPRLRGDQAVAPAEEAALTITAMCNREWDGERWQRPQTSAACRAAAEGGLQTGEGRRWIAAVRGVEDWANVVYRFDGGRSFGRGERWAAFAALAPGLHTIEARELRGGVWTAWSAPYAFTIRGVPPTAALTITALCNGDWETSRECVAAGRVGIDPSERWMIWVADVEEWANVRYRLGGGAAVPWDELSLRGLPPGPHTIEAREWRRGAWTAWSAPYAFTIRVDERAIVVAWLWEWYEYFGEQYVVVAAIIDWALDGTYSYSYAGDSLWAIYEALPAWSDALAAEPLPALRGHTSCTAARDWIALNGKDLALYAGWWGVAFRDFPYGDYDDELREAASRYNESRGEVLDAVRRCEQG